MAYASAVTGDVRPSGRLNSTRTGMTVKVTANYPLEEVKRLAKIASKGINHKHLRIWIKNCFWAFAGRAYNYNYAVVRIGKPHRFPIQNHKYRGLKRAPTYDLNDWKEALVVVIAHELRHLQQMRLNKPRSEVDAERWAVKRLEEYRVSKRSTK